MRLLARSIAGPTVAFLTAGAAALAQGAANCSHDTLPFEGTPIFATFCAAAPQADAVSVTETFTRGTQTITRPLTIDLVSGAPVTRIVDRVPLDDLGSDRRLQLTIAYRNGTAILEHALLLPGAIVLK